MDLDQSAQLNANENNDDGAELTDEARKMLERERRYDELRSRSKRDLRESILALEDDLEKEVVRREKAEARVEELQSLLDEANEKIKHGIEANGGKDWDNEPVPRQVSLIEKTSRALLTFLELVAGGQPQRLQPRDIRYGLPPLLRST